MSKQPPKNRAHNAIRILLLAVWACLTLACTLDPDPIMLGAAIGVILIVSVRVIFSVFKEVDRELKLILLVNPITLFKIMAIAASLWCAFASPLWPSVTLNGYALRFAVSGALLLSISGLRILDFLDNFFNGSIEMYYPPGFQSFSANKPRSNPEADKLRLEQPPKTPAQKIADVVSRVVLAGAIVACTMYPDHRTMALAVVVELITAALHNWIGMKNARSNFKIPTNILLLLGLSCVLVAAACCWLTFVPEWNSLAIDGYALRLVVSGVLMTSLASAIPLVFLLFFKPNMEVSDTAEVVEPETPPEFRRKKKGRTQTGGR